MYRTLIVSLVVTTTGCATLSSPPCKPGRVLPEPHIIWDREFHTRVGLERAQPSQDPTPLEHSFGIAIPLDCP